MWGKWTPDEQDEEVSTETDFGVKIKKWGCMFSILYPAINDCTAIGEPALQFHSVCECKLCTIGILHSWAYNIYCSCSPAAKHNNCMQDHLNDNFDSRPVRGNIIW